MGQGWRVGVQWREQRDRERALGPGGAAGGAESWVSPGSLGTAGGRAWTPHSSPCWRSSRWISWKEGRCLVSLLQQLSISLYTESGQMAGWGRYVFGPKNEYKERTLRKRGGRKSHRIAVSFACVPRS